MNTLITLADEPLVRWRAMTPAERDAWKAMEDTERAREDREQTAALRRYLTRRILDVDDPTVSFSALAEAVDPTERWWLRPRCGPARGQGRLGLGPALYHLAMAEWRAGRPLLPALVGYKHGNEVGPPSDYFPLVAIAWCDFDIPPGTEEAFVRNEVRRVQRYWRGAAGQL